MRKYKRLAIYIWIITIVIWLVTLIAFYETEWPLLTSGIAIGASIWATVFISFPPKYNGVLQYDSDVNDHTEKWNLIVNGEPSQWTTMDELIIKVEERRDDI